MRKTQLSDSLFGRQLTRANLLTRPCHAAGVGLGRCDHLLQSALDMIRS